MNDQAMTPEAIGRLGVDYWHGWNVPQSYALAVNQFQIAAAGGDTASDFWLGVAMAEGRGTPQNVAAAREHLAKAANAGNPAARSYLDTLTLREKGPRPAPGGVLTLCLIAAVAGAVASVAAALGFQQPPLIAAAAFAGGFVIVGGILWLMRPEPDAHAEALAAVAKQQVHSASVHDEGTI
jgi:hypothetical protein